MAGMYEKLGDLLNETLEAGHVKFVHIEREEPAAEAADKQKEPEPETETETQSDFARSFYRAEAEAEKRYFKTSRSREDGGTEGRRIIYRRVTPELEKAFALLGLDSTAGKEDVKKAYKAKLLYYHPDRYAGKEVMEKVANDKTREVVNAYRLVMDFLA